MQSHKQIWLFLVITSMLDNDHFEQFSQKHAIFSNEQDQWSSIRENRQSMQNDTTMFVIQNTSDLMWKHVYPEEQNMIEEYEWEIMNWPTFSFLEITSWIIQNEKRKAQRGFESSIMRCIFLFLIIPYPLILLICRLVMVVNLPKYTPFLKYAISIEGAR